MPRVTLLAGAAAIAAVPPAAAQTLHYEGSVSVASGEYIFTDRTTSWSVLTGLALGAGPFTFRLTMPVYAQNTTLLSGSTTGPLPTGGPHSGDVSDSSRSRRGGGGGGNGGMGTSLLAGAPGPIEPPATAVTGFEVQPGDPSVAAAVELLREGRTGVTLSAGAKVPLTDTTRFGTGAWDVGGSVSISRTLGLHTLIGVSLSYWHLGDLPDLDLQDPVSVSGGVSFLATSGWGVSASASGARSIVAGFEGPYTLGGGVAYLSRRGLISLEVAAGLSETAPDVSVALSWRVGILRTQ
jgi:hypothetical protein